MAREFAKGFYDSPAWKGSGRKHGCRDAFLESKHWTCEDCGHRATIAHHKIWLTPANINDPEITLRWDNLKAVCYKCHKSIEHGNSSGVPAGYAFDSMGNLIER